MMINEQRATIFTQCSYLKQGNSCSLCTATFSPGTPPLHHVCRHVAFPGIFRALSPQLYLHCRYIFSFCHFVLRQLWLRVVLITHNRKRCFQTLPTSSKAILWIASIISEIFNTSPPLLPSGSSFSFTIHQRGVLLKLWKARRLCLNQGLFSSKCLCKWLRLCSITMGAREPTGSELTSTGSWWTSVAFWQKTLFRSIKHRSLFESGILIKGQTQYQKRNRLPRRRIRQSFSEAAALWNDS